MVFILKAHYFDGQETTEVTRGDRREDVMKIANVKEATDLSVPLKELKYHVIRKRDDLNGDIRKAMEAKGFPYYTLESNLK